MEIEGGQKVRYIGIDTAEMDDKDPTKLCYAKKAFEKNKELVEDKEVRLEKDLSETDKYGRLLRYVYIGDVFVNDYLVRNGFAGVTTYPPDIKFKDQFLEAEKEARENNRGLWSPSTCLNQ
jgi:micrococcal nuclease